MPTHIKSRKVQRVLVMLDYGDGEPDTGEVFDLTELVRECAAQSKHQHAEIRLRVLATNDYAVTSDYNATGKYPLKTEANWSAMVDFNSTGDTGHLDDAINAGMPDSFTTAEIRKKLARLRTKQQQLENDILEQRLRDAATIRHQHPIARVMHTAPALAAINPR